MLDAARRLSAAEVAERVRRLGFRRDDATDALAAGAAVAAAGEEHLVQELGERVLTGIGMLDGYELPDPWAVDAARNERYGAGVLPLLALVATADEVVAYAQSRGISAEQAWRSLSDLGQQVHVHRLTYGSFGLHTHGWLRLAWAGNLHWLGRLQFNLVSAGGRWVASTHIPQTGPLTPPSVDQAFAAAGSFFDRHFADHPVREFHCFSWLLDPQLADALPAESNLARFSRRWQRYGEPDNGDADALFFVFHRRGAVDLADLPQTTTLQRVIVDRLQAGGHWQVWNGRIPRAEQRRGDHDG